MASEPRSIRPLIIIAVGFFTLDGVLLVAAWFWTGRPVMLVGAVFCFLAAGAAVLLGRRYNRILANLDEARAELRREVERMQDDLRQ